MTLLCQVTRIIYGYSGNELMPPIERNEYFMYAQYPGETADEFKLRMSDLVMLYNEAAKAAPVRFYSIMDGWSWQFIDTSEKFMAPIADYYPTQG